MKAIEHGKKTINVSRYSRECNRNDNDGDRKQNGLVLFLFNKSRVEQMIPF